METPTRARCYERESVPYKAVDGIVDALAGFLGGIEAAPLQALLPPGAELLPLVFPVMGPVIRGAARCESPTGAPDPLELRLRVFSALRHLLSRLARQRPVVMLIDDLQWTDADSMVLFGEVLRPPEVPPLLLVVARRSQSTAVRRSPAAPGMLLPLHRIIQLAPLPPEDARSLARLLLGGLVHESGGHPLFLQELACRAREGGAGQGPLRLQDALRDRVTRLAAGAGHLLRLIALAETPLSQQAAAAAAAGGPEDFLRDMSILRAARLVRSAGVRTSDTVEPYHDRVREAVLAELAPAIRGPSHRRLAEVLEESGQASAEVLASHWRGAGEPARAASYAVQAAGEADRALAFDRAARLYGMALELGAPDAPHRRELLSRRAEALAKAGRGPEAGEAYLAAAQAMGSQEGLEYRRLAAEEFLHHGHIDAGLAVLQGLLRAVGIPRSPTPRRALLALLRHRLWLRLRGLGYRERREEEVPPELLLTIDVCGTACTGLFMVEALQAAVFLSRHTLLALRAGECGRLARALSLEAIMSAVSGGSTPRTERLLRAVQVTAAKSAAPRARAEPLICATSLAFWDGRWQATCSLAREAEETLAQHCTGVVWEIAAMQFLRLFALGVRGELKELGQQAPLLMHRARSRGDLFSAVRLRVGYHSLLWLAQDDAEGARSAVEDAMAEWALPGFQMENLLGLMAHLMIDLYLGAGAAGRERLAAGWPALARSQLLKVQLWRITAVDLRACCALATAGGDAGDAGHSRSALLRAAKKDARRLAREGRPWALALSRRLQAAYAAASGDTATALSLLEQAAAGFDGADMALHAAAARYRRGALLGGAEGSALVTAAEDWMAGQGIRAPARMSAMLMPGFSVAKV